MNGESKVTIVRGTAYVDRLRAYKVMVDGNEVGRIKNGETQSFPVAAGSHTLQLKIDWASSPDVGFDVAPGGEATFACRPKGNAMTSMLYALFTRKAYILVEPAQAA